MIVVARRADAAEAGVGHPGRADRRHVAVVDRRSPRTARSGTRCATSCASRSRRAAPRPTSRRRWRSSSVVGFPVLVRPSYVLGGRAMQIVHDVNQLAEAMARAGRVRHRSGARAACRPSVRCSSTASSSDAIEVDVDAVRDHTGEVLIGGVMEHVEEAGVHSGDSACAIPPPTLRVVGRRGDRGLHGGDRRPPRRARADQRAVRGRPARPSTSSRPTRGPAAPCRSSPRRPACRWPRWRRG